MGQFQEVKLIPTGSGGAVTYPAVAPPQPATVSAVQFTVENVAAAAPAAPSATASAAGGTQAIATYYYVIASVSAAGLESVQSTEVHSTITTSTGSTTLSWSTVSGSAAYKVYRGVAPATETVFYTTTTGAMTDDGSLGAGTAGTPLTTTPTVTWKAQGSFDKTNFYDVPYITDATAVESQAVATMTTAVSKIHWLALAPNRFFPFYRIVTTTSVASQLLYNATAFVYGE